MELQEIEDRLETLGKEIEDLEGKPDGYLFMEDLLRQQEKLFEKVDRTLPHCSLDAFDSLAQEASSRRRQLSHSSGQRSTSSVERSRLLVLQNTA